MLDYSASPEDANDRESLAGLILISTNQKKLKICHIAATTEGATWMIEQLSGLRDRYGFEVTAVVSGNRGGLIDRLRAENIRFHVANFEAGVGAAGAMLAMPLSIFRLAQFLRRERFDVVQTHIFKSMTIGRPAAWLADAPVRLAMIAGPFHLEAYSSRWIERMTYWMDTKLIPACENSRDLCRELGVPESRLGPIIYYAPNPANFDPAKISPAGTRAEFGWPEDTPVICHVAYFYPRLPHGKWIPALLHGRGVKGHGDLIRSMPIILRQVPEAKLVLVGTGWSDAGKQYMQEMQALVRELNLESNVIFTGFRADANRILKEADVAVQPSLSENCGGAFEALLLEKPLVATRVGGLVDVVRDQETGILVRPSDPEDLARGILEVLRDPEKARAFGRAGRERMLEKFTIDITVEEQANLYRELIQERRGKSFYSPVKSMIRLLIAGPVFAYMVFRLVFVDIYAPIYMTRAKTIPTRFLHFGYRFLHLGYRLCSFALGRAYRASAAVKRLRRDEN